MAPAKTKTSTATQQAVQETTRAEAKKTAAAEAKAEKARKAQAAKEKAAATRATNAEKKKAAEAEAAEAEAAKKKAAEADAAKAEAAKKKAAETEAAKAAEGQANKPVDVTDLTKDDAAPSSPTDKGAGAPATLHIATFIRQQFPQSTLVERATLIDIWGSRGHLEMGTEAYLRQTWSTFILLKEVEEKVGAAKRPREPDAPTPSVPDPYSSFKEDVVVDFGCDRTPFSKFMGYHYHVSGTTGFGYVGVAQDASRISPVGETTAGDRKKARAPEMNMLDSALWLSSNHKAFRIHQDAKYLILHAGDLLKAAWAADNKTDWMHYCMVAAADQGYSGPKCQDMYDAVARALLVAQTGKSLENSRLSVKSKLAFVEANQAEMLGYRSRVVVLSTEAQARVERMEREEQQAELALAQQRLLSSTLQMPQLLHQPVPMQHLLQAPVPRSFPQAQPPSLTGTSTLRLNPACWACGKPGHRADKCPAPAQGGRRDTFKFI